jgi:hypothetical protein
VFGPAAAVDIYRPEWARTSYCTLAKLLDCDHHSTFTMASAKEKSDGGSQKQPNEKEAKPSGFKCYMVS